MLENGQKPRPRNFPCRFDSICTQEVERESQGRVKRAFSMGTWEKLPLLDTASAGAYDGSATTVGGYH